eukprot:GILJ01004347.1.p1 GENE.GILJ01004347.1~~GILJ01004347.1.p1  ORF type:complete len:572 (-),score=147.36 GILJ01004347.1:176-1870(-)
MEHPDVLYLKEQVGPYLAEGLASVCISQPEDPVDFLGKWLLNFVSTKELELQLEKDKLQREKDHKTQFEATAGARLEEEKAAASKRALEADDSRLSEELASCEEPDALLPGILNQLKNATGATGVYVGDYKEAGAGAEGEEIEAGIRYIAATEDHQWLLDEILPEEVGVTYDVFKADEQEDEEEAAETDEQEGEQPKKKSKIVHVPNVLRDERMHFHNIPLLGAYVAVPLTYNSCLFEEAFDAGVTDTIHYGEELAQYEADRKEKEASKAAAAASEEAGGEDEEEEEEEPLTVSPPVYQTRTRRLVLCLDTLGQNRDFSSENIEYIQQWVDKMVARYEAAERESLAKSIEEYIKSQQANKGLAEKHTAEAEAEEEKISAEVAAALPEDASEEVKKFTEDKLRFDRAKMEVLKFKTQILELRTYKVIKHPRVFQVAFYLLGFEKNSIVQKESSNLDWNKARMLLNEKFFTTLQEYTPLGPKKGIKPYAKIDKLVNHLKDISQEEVDQYSIALGSLYRWLSLSLNVRQQDVHLRKQQAEEARERAQEEGAEAPEATEEDEDMAEDS